MRKLIVILDLLSFWLLYSFLAYAVLAVPLAVVVFLLGCLDCDLRHVAWPWPWLIVVLLVALPLFVGAAFAIRKTKKWHSKEQNAFGVQHRADEHLGELPKNANRQS